MVPPENVKRKVLFCVTVFEGSRACDQVSISFFWVKHSNLFLFSHGENSGKGALVWFCESSVHQHPWSSPRQPFRGWSWRRHFIIVSTVLAPVKAILLSCFLVTTFNFFKVKSRKIGKRISSDENVTRVNVSHGN